MLVLPVEAGPPGHQFPDPLRPLADHALDDLGIAQRAARRQGVGHVIFAAIVGPHRAGDAPLGVPAVGLQQPVLGDQQDRQLGIDGQGRPQSRQSAAKDQHVGEEVRHVLGMEGHQVTGSRGRHGRTAGG